MESLCEIFSFFGGVGVFFFEMLGEGAGVFCRLISYIFVSIFFIRNILYYCLFLVIYEFIIFLYFAFKKKVLVICFLKVHCLSSLSQRTFGFGREQFFKRVFLVLKKKIKKVLDT